MLESIDEESEEETCDTESSINKLERPDGNAVLLLKTVKDMLTTKNVNF